MGVAVEKCIVRREKRNKERKGREAGVLIC